MLLPSLGMTELYNKFIYKHFIIKTYGCSLLQFFVDHRESCDYRSCSAKVMRDFVQRRIVSVFGGSNPENEAIKNALIDSINGMEISLVGFGLKLFINILELVLTFSALFSDQ